MGCHLLQNDFTTPHIDRNQKQLSLAEFGWPFQTVLDKNNRWVKLGECIPGDALTEGYYQDLDETQGRPTPDARLARIIHE